MEQRTFRDWIDLWDEVQANTSLIDQIRSAMDGHGLCFFFIKDGGVYGAPEDSRVSFARMKHPDPEEGLEDGDFMGLGLDSLLGGGDVMQRLFGRADIDDIQIIDQDAAAEHVAKKHKTKKAGKKDKK